MLIYPDQRIALATIKMGEFKEGAVGQQLLTTVTKAQAGTHNGQPGKLAALYTIAIQVVRKLRPQRSAPILPTS